EEPTETEEAPPSEPAPESAPVAAAAPDLSEDLEIYKLEVEDLNRKLKQVTDTFSEENAKLLARLSERDDHVLRLNEQLQVERAEKEKALANERLQISKRNEFETALNRNVQELEALQADLDATEEKVVMLNAKVTEFERKASEATKSNEPPVIVKELLLQWGAAIGKVQKGDHTGYKDLLALAARVGIDAKTILAQIE